MAHPARFELTTSASGGQRSIQLSYGCVVKRSKLYHSSIALKFKILTLALVTTFSNDLRLRRAAFYSCASRSDELRGIKAMRIVTKLTQKYRTMNCIARHFSKHTFFDFQYSA